MTAQNPSLAQHVRELENALPKIHKLEPAQLDLLGAYVDLIIKWNSKVRLISSSDEARIIKRHIVESLVLHSVQRIPSGATVLDLGAGAGLPGIPLKIAEPTLRLTLLDSRRMKALFLEEAVRVLKLSDTHVAHDRAEKVAEHFAGKFDCVVARAVSSLYNLWQWSAPILKNGGVLLAQKGGDLSSETSELLAAYPRLNLEKLEYDSVWQVEPSRFVIAIKKEAT